MSSSDKAKSKLLDSMRMSKQGSTPEVTTSETPAPEKKAKPSANKSAGTDKKSKPATKSSAAKKPITDNFQAAQRVWPD